MNHACLILNIALLKQMVLAPMQIFFSILIFESFLSKVIIKTIIFVFFVMVEVFLFVGDIKFVIYKITLATNIS